MHVFDPTNVHGWVVPALEKLLLISFKEDIWKCIPLLFQTQMDSAQCPLSKKVATNREFNKSIESDLESADRQARVATLGLSNSLPKTCPERPG